jgi:hypothetical protein
MSKKPLTIWFEANGDMLDQGSGSNSYGSTTYGWKSEEAKDFDDRMVMVKLQEYYKKNTRVLLKSVTTGRKYSMFVDDFNAALDKKRFINLHLEGTFQFIKRGSGQAIKLVLGDK